MFNWNNYIGNHMNKPLKCVFSDGDIQNVIGYNRYKSNNEFYEELIYEDENTTQNWDYAESCKPLIKSISDLTDEELLFVFGGTHEKINPIQKEDDIIWFNEKRDDCKHWMPKNYFSTKTKVFNICDQQILNRLYYLHVSLDYEELIRTGKAVRKI